MTTVMIVPENPGAPDTRFRAVSGDAQSEGQTAGAALDAIAEQIGNPGDGLLVVVRSFGPDQFFSAEQRTELKQLMSARRSVKSRGEDLSPADMARLETLVDAELDAASCRFPQA